MCRTLTTAPPIADATNTTATAIVPGEGVWADFDSAVANFMGSALLTSGIAIARSYVDSTPVKAIVGRFATRGRISRFDAGEVAPDVGGVGCAAAG